jgi:hypothetical protein
MKEERLDELLNDARTTYRIPPDAPVEEMWASIDAALGGAGVRSGGGTAGGTGGVRRATSWSLVAYAAAATFVLGVGIGRLTSPAGSIAALEEVAQSVPRRPIAVVGEPLTRATSDYLGEAEALIQSVQRGSGGGNGAYASEAATLLMTTRLLLDSPAASDARLRDLLEDLELALVQIAALRGAQNPERRTEELNFIRHALAEREMVPRLRTAVVTLASYED